VTATAVLAAADAYIYVGWAATAVAAVAYGVSLVQRGRRASAQVPEGKRRWSDPS
jgi:hypothetical protein